MPTRRPLLHGSLVRGALGALLLSSFAAPASALTLVGEAAQDLKATELAANLGGPTDAVELPDGRVVVLEKGGNVKTFTPGMDDPAVDKVTVVTGGQNEQGLLGIVADPGFATNHYIYIYGSVVEDAENRHQVRRYTLGDDGKLSAMKPVIDMGLMGPANHNGGGLSIYDGYLFVGVGDTGKNNATPHNHIGSCLNLANGKILRVKLTDDTSLGQPADDNPLMAVDMVSGCDTSSANDDDDFVMRPPEKRVYAWGFRNPFRLWADPVTGKLWVGDVGESSREEISLVEKGKHYGYPFEEGSKKYTKAQQDFQPEGTCMGMTPASACIAPITDYDTKAAPTGKGSVMAGRILDGCGWPEKWRSRFIFGDHEQGEIWSIDVNAARDGMVAGSQKDFATANGVTAMHFGTDNALYVVEYSAGKVTRVTANAAPEATPGSCPAVGSGGPGGGGGAGGGSSTGGGSGSSTGGSSVSGGVGAGGSGNPIPGTGGSAGAAGGVATAGAAGSGGAPGSTADGCGCRVVSGRGSAALGFAAFAGALGLVLGRRRARHG